MPSIFIADRGGETGWEAHWVDTDIHGAIVLLEVALAKLREEHEAEHAKEEHDHVAKE